MEAQRIEIGPVVRNPSSGNNTYGLNRLAGSVAVIGDTEISIPKGAYRMQLQARQCGDVYAEIAANDDRQVGGFGPDAAAAIQAATAKLVAA